MPPPRNTRANHWLRFARLIAVLFVMVFGNDAFARLTAYTGVVCEEGGDPVCEMTSSSQWTCNLAANGGGSGGQVTVVFADGDAHCDAYDYCAYGTDSSGTLFFCPITDTDIRSIWAVGSDYNDTIRFKDNNNTSYRLDSHTGGVQVNGVAVAGTGDDTIYGSNSENVDYTDVLHGDNGDDSINADNGDDQATGDVGADSLWGEEGEDVLDGGPGNDTLRGGDGVDTIRGGSGHDRISGGDEDDLLLDGQAGNDAICGDDGDDYLHGGDDDDELWADDGDATGQETNGGSGGTDNDSCQDSAVHTDCEDPTMTTKPTLCPSES